MAVEKVDDRTYNINLNLNVKGGNGTGEELKTPQEKQEEDKGNFGSQPGVDKAKNVSKGEIALGIAYQQVSKVAMAAVDSYGNITGDYLAQSNLQAVANVGMSALGVVSAFSTAGFKGGMVATLGTAISTGLNIYNYYSERAMANKNARWLAQRTGYAAFR